MDKRATKKPRVQRLPLPEGVSACVSSATAPPLTLGTAHVTFTMESAPHTEVTLCVENDRVAAVVIQGQVSTRALRLPLRALERCALAQLAETPSYRNGPVPYASEAGAREAGAARMFSEMGRTVEKSPESRDMRLAVLAARYVQLCIESATPVKDLAAERYLSTATVRDQLHEARRRKLLDKRPRGLAGGQLTPKAVALLTADEED